MHPVSARRAATVGIFVLVAAPFLVRPELIGGDEPHYAAMTWSVAMDGDFDPANQYEQSARGELPTAGRRFFGALLERHLVPKPAGDVSSHPLGLPVLAAAPLAIALRLGVPISFIFLLHYRCPRSRSAVRSAVAGAADYADQA